MPDRVQVADLYQSRGYLPTVQPTARPVDTFITPSAPKQDIRLLELAKAWSEVQPGLTKFTQERIAHSNELDAEEGRKSALANKAQFKDAVNKGVIPAGASPWFRVGYERQKATRTSVEYDQAMREAYEKTDLVNSDDPNAVSQWMAEFTKGFLESNPDAQSNPEFGRTFQVMGAKSQDSLHSFHAAARTKKIEEDAAADTAFMLGAALDKSVDLLGNRNPNLGEELATIVSERVANSLPGPMANKLVADAVIRKAVAEGDVTILDLLEEVPSGSGTVGQIGYVKDAVSAAKDQINGRASQRDRISKLKTDDDRKNLINSVRGEAYRAIVANPYADTSAAFQTLTRIDPDEAAKIESFRTAYLGSLNAQNKVIENGPLKTGMYLDAMRGELTDDQVMSSVTNGTIDADTAKDLLTNVIPKSKEQKSLLNDPAVTRYVKSIGDIITKNELADDFADQRQFRASEATSTFLQGMMQYKEANPKATMKDLLREGRELQKEILELYREEGAEPLPNAQGQAEGRQKATEPVKVDAGTARSQPLFKSAQELQAAIAEAAQTGGASGRLKDLADLYKIDPVELMTAQMSLYGRQNSQPKK